MLLSTDRETVNIHHWLTLSAEDEISLKIEVVRPDKRGGRKRVTVEADDLRKIEWKSEAEIAASKKGLFKQALNMLVDQLATYNRLRAVKYARNMLHHQTLGNATPAPCSGRYEFAKLSLTLNALPLLDKDDLEQGDTTVVMFASAELSGRFEGKSALRGKKMLKTATG